MSTNDLAKDPKKLLGEMLSLRKDVYLEGTELFQKWEPHIKRTEFAGSAKNLAYYLALRKRDIRELQEALTPWGLSSLGRLESRTMDNLDAVITSLTKIAGIDQAMAEYPSYESFLAGQKQLSSNADALFGQIPEKRATRIMVTLPTEAGTDSKLVSNLLKKGMNVARINCSHDNPETWKAMIKHIRKAEKKLNTECKIVMDLAGPKPRISWLYTTLKKPKLQVGDTFLLTGKHQLPETQEYGIIAGCSIPEILQPLKKGDAVLVDDGVVEGVVKANGPEGVVVTVKKVQSKKGVRLKAEKGLNFPGNTAKIDILTEKDKEDLTFICQHADIVGSSFVKDAEDISYIQQEIQKRNQQETPMPLMVKIETVQGMQHLPDILVRAAGGNPFSIMIARGDLAVESGYLRLAELQQEVLWICEAADIPVVWATQVLDQLVSNGIPTRAEISDAALSVRAECVMLNKGEYILEGVRMLDDILQKMQEHEYKKTARLRALDLAKQVEGFQE